MFSQIQKLTPWLFQIPSPMSGGMTFYLNQLFQNQSNALSIPAHQTQSSTRIGVVTTLVIWQAIMANYSVCGLATRPALEWFLSLLPRWADTYTALTPKLGNGVEALIDTSEHEASEKSSSEVQKVQLDKERWYLLFSNTSSATFLFSCFTSACKTSMAATSELSGSGSFDSVCMDRLAV